MTTTATAELHSFHNSCAPNRFGNVVWVWLLSQRRRLSCLFPTCSRIVGLFLLSVACGRSWWSSIWGWAFFFFFPLGEITTRRADGRKFPFAGSKPKFVVSWWARALVDEIACNGHLSVIPILGLELLINRDTFIVPPNHRIFGGSTRESRVETSI